MFYLPLPLIERKWKQKEEEFYLLLNRDIDDIIFPNCWLKLKPAPLILLRRSIIDRRKLEYYLHHTSGTHRIPHRTGDSHRTRRRSLNTITIVM